MCSSLRKGIQSQKTELCSTAKILKFPQNEVFCTLNFEALYLSQFLPYWATIFCKMFARMPTISLRCLTFHFSDFVYLFSKKENFPECFFVLSTSKYCISQSIFALWEYFFCKMLWEVLYSSCHISLLIFLTWCTFSPDRYTRAYKSLLVQSTYLKFYELKFNVTYPRYNFVFCSRWSLVKIEIAVSFRRHFDIIMS